MAHDDGGNIGSPKVSPSPSSPLSSSPLSFHGRKCNLKASIRRISRQISSKSQSSVTYGDDGCMAAVAVASSTAVASGCSIGNNDVTSNNIDNDVGTFHFKSFDDDDDVFGTTSNIMAMSLHDEQAKTYDPVLFDLVDVPLDRMAKHLTAEFSERLCRIAAEELTSGGWTGVMKTALCPNIVAFTRFFNDIAYWVTDEVLRFDTPKARACRIIYFIGLSRKLADMSNLSGIQAIVSALRSAPVHRLRHSWCLVPRKDVDRLKLLDDLVGPEHNYSIARKLMDECVVGVPLLNIFLSDIAMILTIAKTLPEEELAVLLNTVLKRIKAFQDNAYRSAHRYGVMVPELSEYLISVNSTVLEDLQSQTEDRHYALSVSLEPLSCSSPSGMKSPECNKINAVPRVNSLRNLKGSRSLEMLPTNGVNAKQESSRSSFMRMYNKGSYNSLSEPNYCASGSFWDSNISGLESQESSSNDSLWRQNQASKGVHTRVRSLLDDSFDLDFNNEENDGNDYAKGNNLSATSTSDGAVFLDEITYCNVGDLPPRLEAFLKESVTDVSENEKILLHSDVLTEVRELDVDKRKSNRYHYKVELYRHCLTFFGLNRYYKMSKRFKKTAQGSLPLSSILRVEVDLSASSRFSKKKYAFSIVLLQEIRIQFRAASADKRRLWVEAIEKVLSGRKNSEESLIHF